MFEQQPKALREKIKLLATESTRQENPSGWFETLYAEAEGDSSHRYSAVKAVRTRSDYRQVSRGGFLSRTTWNRIPGRKRESIPDRTG